MVLMWLYFMFLHGHLQCSKRTKYCSITQCEFAFSCLNGIYTQISTCSTVCHSPSLIDACALHGESKNHLMLGYHKASYYAVTTCIRDTLYMGSVLAIACLVATFFSVCHRRTTHAHTNMSADVCFSH